MDKSILNKATTSSDVPIPGFLLVEITNMSYMLPDACFLLEEYLLKKLNSSDNANVKQKVLRIIKHLCRSGKKDFKFNMQRKVEVIRACLSFRCVPHPLKGDAPSRAVREEAEECIKAIFASDDNNEESSVSSRIRGFGNTDGNFGVRGEEATAAACALADSNLSSFSRANNSYLRENPGDFKNLNFCGTPNSAELNTACNKITGFGNPRFSAKIGKVNKSDQAFKYLSETATKYIPNNFKERLKRFGIPITANSDSAATSSEKSSTFSYTNSCSGINNHSFCFPKNTEAKPQLNDSHIFPFSSAQSESFAFLHTHSLSNNNTKHSFNPTDNSFFKSSSSLKTTQKTPLSFPTFLNNPPQCASISSSNEYEEKLLDDLLTPVGATTVVPLVVLQDFIKKCYTLDIKVIISLLHKKFIEYKSNCCNDVIKNKLLNKVLCVVEALMLDSEIRCLVDFSDFISLFKNDLCVLSQNNMFSKKSKEILKIMNVLEKKDEKEVEEEQEIQHLSTEDEPNGVHINDSQGKTNFSVDFDCQNIHADLLNVHEEEPNSKSYTLKDISTLRNKEERCSYSKSRPMDEVLNTNSLNSALNFTRDDILRAEYTPTTASLENKHLSSSSANSRSLSSFSYCALNDFAERSVLSSCNNLHPCRSSSSLFSCLTVKSKCNKFEDKSAIKKKNECMKKESTDLLCLNVTTNSSCDQVKALDKDDILSSNDSSFAKSPFFSRSSLLNNNSTCSQLSEIRAIESCSEFDSEPLLLFKNDTFNSEKNCKSAVTSNDLCSNYKAVTRSSREALFFSSLLSSLSPEAKQDSCVSNAFSFINDCSPLPSSFYEGTADRSRQTATNLYFPTCSMSAASCKLEENTHSSISSLLDALPSYSFKSVNENVTKETKFPFRKNQTETKSSDAFNFINEHLEAFRI